MSCEEVMNSPDFRRSADFHGHVCPGLAIGYRAAKAALEHFESRRSSDEELVAVVENDACGVDAVQVLTGCTFGKGNLIYRDYGKQVFYFISRKGGKALRVALKAGAFTPSPEMEELLEKVGNNEASAGELEKFNKLRHDKICKVLEAPLDDIFNIEEVVMEIPEKAAISSSEPCDRCGEPAMSAKLERRDGEKICRECLAAGNDSRTS